MLKKDYWYINCRIFIYITWTIFFLLEFQRRTIFLLTEIRDLLQKGHSVEAQSLLPSSDFNFSVVDTTDDLNSLENSLEDKDFKMKMVSYIYINIRKILNLIVFCVIKESVIFCIVEKSFDESWGLWWSWLCKEVYAEVKNSF